VTAQAPEGARFPGPRGPSRSPARPRGTRRRACLPDWVRIGLTAPARLFQNRTIHCVNIEVKPCGPYALPAGLKAGVPALEAI
jgi:hypothetical protein